MNVEILNSGVAKASEIDKISAKFLKDGSLVITFHLTNIINLSMKLEAFPFKSSRSEIFCKKCFLRNFAKFIGKHLCQSLFFNKVAGRPVTLLKKRLWYRCFPVNFAKFLRTPFLQNTSGGCFCPLKCKITKIKPSFKIRIKAETKNYRPISLLLLISKVIKKTIHHQKIIFKEMSCCKITNQALDQIIPQIHFCLSQLK